MASGEDEVTIDETEADSDVSFSKRKTKAFVWKYFGFEMDGNGRPLCVNLPSVACTQAIQQPLRKIRILQIYTVI